MEQKQQEPGKPTRSAVSFVWWVFKKHVGPFLLFLGFSFAGAALFQFLEAPFEQQGIINVIKTREQLIVDLWEGARSDNYTQEEWRQYALAEIYKYQAFRAEVLQPAFKLYGEEKDMLWTFWGALLYCGTIYTTIGYGLLCPKTVAGKACTIVYAILGIPLCMMVLNNFGKIMALAIRKLHWVLWLLYKYAGTGARATGHMVGNVAGLAGHAAGKAASTLQRKVRHQNNSTDHTQHNTQLNTESPTDKPTDDVQENRQLLDSNKTEPTREVINDKPVAEHKTEEDFNPSPLFPVVVVIVFVLFGAWMYTQWESWTYFESVYFIFISLSTIGLGDIIPSHPLYFMSSSLYLFFGLTLVSFFINTVLLQIQKVAKQAKKAPGKMLNMGRRHLHRPSEGAVKQKSPSDTDIKLDDSEKPHGEAAMV